MRVTGDAQRRAKAISGSVIVRATKDGTPVFYGVWRDSTGRSMNRKAGEAWVELLPATRNPFLHDDSRPEALPPGARGAESWRDTWRERKGRAPEGFIAARKVGSVLDDLIHAREVEIDNEAIEDLRRAASPGGDVLRFEDVADAWIKQAVAVGGIKKSTEINYRAMLRRTDDPVAKRGRAPRALLMRKFGGRPVETITERDVKDFLSDLDDDPKLAPRTINIYRQVLSSVFKHAVREGWIQSNPVAGVERRREADPPPLVVYSPEEVRAIARILASGGHRRVEKVKLSPAELALRKTEDETDAAIVITAAFSGMRQSELIALRWSDVSFENARIVVQRNFSAGEETSPKGRRNRSVPMAEPVAQTLAQLSQRQHWTAKNDLVFASRVGDHLNASALRRRYKRARDLAIEANPEMPCITFHELRDTFGTLSASSFDLVNVQAMLGHGSITTTMRYLHARPADDDAAKLSKIFGGEAIDESATAVATDSR